MRSLVTIALGTLALAGSIRAQSLTEHAAAAAGATIGTAAGRPVANALTGIFTQVDDTTATAAKTGDKAKVVKVPIAPDRNKAATENRGANPGSFSPGFSVGGGAAASADSTPTGAQSGSRRRVAQQPAAPQIVPGVPPAMVPEPVKEPSLAQVASVKIGTTEQDLFTMLGKPASQVIVPDDDGHLRESCQYWNSGRQLGTIRLQDGQVVKVEVRAEN